MPRNFNLNTDNNPTWLTPPEIIRALGSFDLDPCCPPNMPWRTATRMFVAGETDGLSAEWGEGCRVWLNPPYGRETFRWLHKLSRHEGGGLALIFARTETQGFHEVVWKRADAVFFFRGRLRFCRADGSRGACANAPSCLVSYNVKDTDAIRDAIISGHLVGKLINL